MDLLMRLIMDELIDTMYAEHCKESSYPCESSEMFVAEFKEEIYYAATQDQ